MTIDYAINVIRRSRLIMPANVPRFVEKAFLRNADAIVLDLEDSVPDSEKIATRKRIRELLPVAGKGGSDVLVRVNHTADLLLGDLEAVIWPSIDGLMLPKVESAEEVLRVEQHISTLEQKRGIRSGHVKIGIIIETAKGMLRLEEIACASARVDSLTLGAEDFSADCGIELGPETYQGMLIPRMNVLIAARAYGKIPMGLMGSIAGYSDRDQLVKNAALAYRHGFLGASCIHPDNVELLNQAFSPTEEDLAYAHQVIEVFEESVAKGRASTKLEGKMIDIPHYEKAKLILDRANKIVQLEEKKKRSREAAIGGL